MPATARDLEIPASRDGFRLRARAYEPGSPPRSVVVIASATAVPQSYYRAFAQRLAERGHLAVTFDYRGIGASRPARLSRFDARMRDWGERDLDGVLAWVEKEHAGLPLALVGHSAGGQIVGLTDRAARASAVLAVAAQSGWWKHWSGAMRWRRFLEFHVLLPGFSIVVGYVPGWTGIGEDLPGGVAREWASWCRHREYLLRDDATARRARFAAIRAPVLSLSIADDAFAPRASVDALAALFEGARVERRHLDPRDVGSAIGHFGFFRARFRDSLWEDALDWLERALALTPR